MRTKKKRRTRNKSACPKSPTSKRKERLWELRLYVADSSPRSLLARGNLRSLCEQYLKGQYRLTIIDIVKEPAVARRDEILATPTLVRMLPGPQKTVIGSLTDTAGVVRALELDQPGAIAFELASSGVKVGNA
ncbi:MAG TPA: circadian clock KaiB family protein [Candidatus Sulfotelmatobacter sp.]